MSSSCPRSIGRILQRSNVCRSGDVRFEYLIGRTFRDEELAWLDRENVTQRDVIRHHGDTIEVPLWRAREEVYYVSFCVKAENSNVPRIVSGKNGHKPLHHSVNRGLNPGFKHNASHPRVWQDLVQNWRRQPWHAA